MRKVHPIPPSHRIPRVPALGGLGARALVVVLALAIVLALGACGQDPAPACNEAYQHLIAIAKRNHDPLLLSRFVAACSDAWDPPRVACLIAATTPSEAILCKSKKKRPG